MLPVPLESYEKYTKPKTVAELSDQQVFDLVTRKLVAQRIPCMKMQEPKLDGGAPTVPVSKTNRWNSVLFNCSGLVGPLLAPLSLEDLKFLKREIGYTELQEFKIDAYYERVFHNPPETHFDLTGKYKATDLIIARLEGRGIKSKATKSILYWMQDYHDAWAEEVNAVMDLMDVDKKLVFSFSSEALYKKLERLAHSKGFDKSVLKFHSP